VFSLPEVKIGIGVIMGTARVTRIAGAAATKEMILLGKRFSAKSAYDYGLVHEVVPPEKLDTRTAALAGRFMKLPPRTVGISKRIINSGQDMPLRDSQDLEIDAQMELLDSPDMREAFESYIEKRGPKFTGK
jgi:enoyl-CoA hydratase/carnithine racemase